MEGLQTQINQLQQQINTLNQSIEQLSQYIVGLLGDRQPSHSVPSPDLVGHHNGPQNRSYHEMMMQSKDVLIEDGDAEYGRPRSEKNMSPELQIQRLTAQLTAAYNRIAALEEQLLAQRIA
ncbi:MAG: hypothetical protein RLZZ511_1454 [Cyanobacteriota bacterium]|jgi:hypothetical protein